MAWLTLGFVRMANLKRKSGGDKGPGSVMDAPMGKGGNGNGKEQIKKYRCTPTFQHRLFMVVYVTEKFNTYCNIYFAKDCSNGVSSNQFSQFSHLGIGRGTRDILYFLGQVESDLLTGTVCHIAQDVFPINI